MHYLANAPGHEHFLAKDPLRYAIYIRTVFLFSDVVVVNFSLSLVQLLEVDEKSQTIKTIAWISYVR